MSVQVRYYVSVAKLLNIPLGKGRYLTMDIHKETTLEGCQEDLKRHRLDDDGHIVDRNTSG